MPGWFMVKFGVFVVFNRASLFVVQIVFVCFLCFLIALPVRSVVELLFVKCDFFTISCLSHDDIAHFVDYICAS